MKDIVYDIKNGKKANNISAAGLISGSSNNGLFSKHYRYCIQCMQNDHETYGECYLHKYHQFRYLDVCYKHRSLLITHCPLCNELLAKVTGDNLLVKPQCPNGCSLIDEPSGILINKELKCELLSDMIYLSEAKISINTNELSHKFIACLGEKGYIHPSGIINKVKMIRDF